MKTKIIFLLCICITTLVYSYPPSLEAKTLIQKENLVYVGAFRVPRGNLGGDSTIYSFGRGGRGLAYNQNNNSLILSGKDTEKLAIEISIPTPVNSTNIADLNYASLVQAPGNITGGTWSNLGKDGSLVPNGGVVGDFLVYSNRLVLSAYAYYDANVEAALSHGVASLDWAVGGANFSGFKRVGTPVATSVNGGFVGDSMTKIPAEWQSSLGYPALTGAGALPIVTRTSMGPSIWGFDPDDIGVVDPAPATAFVVYPLAHPTLGDYSDSPSLYYNRSTNFGGMVFPDQGDTVLVFGRHGLGITGLGDSCYGTGTADETLHGTDVGDGSHYCYDPLDTSKGGHAYPYVYQVWAYDANDLLSVKKGEMNYWEVIPDVWNFDLPFAPDNHYIYGATYDPGTKRIFVSQYMADTWADQYEPNPIIHVFKVQLDVADSGVLPPQNLSL